MKDRRARTSFSLILTVCAVAACAPQRPARPTPEAAPPASGAAAGSVPLYTDLGSHHHPVSTRSPLAQRYFDQGLTLAYGFNHEEAMRAFEEAARLDPGLAMAHWGVALTLGTNINRPADPARNRLAFEAVQRARALAHRATAAERAYIEALAPRYEASAKADQAALDGAYADAMRELSRRYPGDLDAATLYAEALMNLRPWDYWTPEGQPQPGTSGIIATLEEVLRRAPDHVGANHFYIHAVEASPQPERALPSAERLRRLAPGAGHLAHMPAHIYMRTGRYADASGANARGAEADRRYLRERPAGFYGMMYYPHNVHFLSVSASMEGRSGAALEAAREAVRAAPDDAVREMPMMEMFRVAPLHALVRFGRWAEIMAEPAPPAEQRFTTAIWHYARGMALASAGRPSEAAREAAALAAIEAAIPAGMRIGLSPARDVLRVASRSLEGRLLLRRGQPEGAIRALEEAVRAEDALHYDEPPDWPLPARHLLGAALLQAGRPREAEAVYQEDLRRNPENGWALAGLEQSLRAQGRGQAAAEAHRRFEQAWARADVKITGSSF